MCFYIKFIAFNLFNYLHLLYIIVKKYYCYLLFTFKIAMVPNFQVTVK